ncbi:ribbon-helix-helix protein, CopG family [Nostoc sp. CENA543]
MRRYTAHQNIRLSQEDKEKLLALCKSRGLKPAELIRQLIDNLVNR